MPNQVTALIVDDELHNRIVLEAMLWQHCPEVSAIYQADNVQQAMLLVKEHCPNILFLDIQLQGETGFDLLQQMGEYHFEVIFITAHDNYAIKAFRFNAVDYLLKPVLVNELKEAFGKALVKLRAQNAKGHENIHRLQQQISNSNGMTDSITIPTAEGFLVKPVKDIVYCQASNNYTILHMADHKKITSSYTLGYYEDLLADSTFFRAHRSFLINLPHVSSYKKGEAGYIVMSNGDEVELARNHKTNFIQLFKGS
ncbi:MAG: response regulator transcription factor [Gloeobacteraceae cyanobacterium ES-bin-316]|nr:response regulator transcription factor [Ferruginibacter sp.]